MLNAHVLSESFILALEKSWDADAIWPGCKNAYEPGTSHPSYGQCLVATLATWKAHNGLKGSFRLVSGILKGDNMPENGVWHFQLDFKNPDNSHLPVDVTWDQVKNGKFTAAMDAGGLDLYQSILEGSFSEDESLVGRLGIILENLKYNGQDLNSSAEDIIQEAYESLKF